MSDCDDGEVTDKCLEEVLGSDSDVLSVEDDSPTSLGSEESITTPIDDGSYPVTWTLDIALAVPRGEETDVHEGPEKAKKTSKDSAAVYKAQCSFHIEYKLLPDDTETVKVDLILFGPIAKMCMGEEFKIVRTWHEGGQTWIGWTQTFNTTVNRDLLMRLLPHKINVQIWNSKDKLSSQARYERLKFFRQPLDQMEEASDTLCVGLKTMVNRLRTLSERTSNTLKKSKSDVPSKSTSEVGSDTAGPKPMLDPLNLELLKKNGTVSAEISLLCLFADEISLTEHFPVYSSGVFEVLCNVSLDKPLISDQLKAELNPMVITILSATSMPSSPVPFHILQEKCAPVYCQYKFHKFSMHRTRHVKHDTDIYFGDVNVMLTGLMDPEELKEFLSGPPLEIEVHDRDRKLEEKQTSPARLSTGTEDAAASLKQKTTFFNPHGVASLNLSTLLLNEKSLKVNLQIKCCPPPQVLDRERSAWNRKMTDTASGREPMPQGHYLDAYSQLKVKIALACPLNVESSGRESTLYDGPFGRIIYILDYNNVSVLTKLRSEVFRLNASALHLGPRSLENMEKSLSNYIMNFKHDESKDLDFITGFHVLDKRMHIFVLEGLKHKAVRRLWESVPMKLSGSGEEQVIVLYNSNLGFFKRIYDSLDVGLRPIHLCESLETIMRQPLVYVRGKIPKLCFQALSRLSQLCQVRQLKDVVEYNLFPSADMIVSMSNEFGMYAEQWDQKIGAHTEVDRTALPVRIKRHAVLDTYNINYSQQLPLKHFKDFIQENIKKVHEESERLHKPECAVLRLEQSAAGPAYNYSIQSLNSKQQAMELLQKAMAQVPGRRFTYSQQYLSATVEPGDRKKHLSSCASSTAWSRITPSVSRKLDEARLEALMKPWRENILHGNILRPPRDTWFWSEHDEDFELYSKPPPFFSPTPVTIHLAGDLLRQEQLEAARAQYSRWLKKLLPAGSAPGEPCPQFRCHMGGRSARNLDILKDEPNKYSLKKPGMMLEPLPHVYVMNLGEDPAEGQRSAMAMAPGPCTDCSLSSKNNAISRHTSLYNKYHYLELSQPHSFLHKRSAPPLTDEEKCGFTFQKQTVARTKAPDTAAQTYKNIVEARTHKDYAFYTK